MSEIPHRQLLRIEPGTLELQGLSAVTFSHLVIVNVNFGLDLINKIN